MKRNRGIQIVTMALLGLSTIAFARDGSGVRGGGQIVDVDSTPTLVDLVSKAVCNWQSGMDVVAAHPAFTAHVIEPLRKLDWYFADDLLSDAQSLRFCFTGPLYRETPSDPGDPVRPPAQAGVRQIGYRLNDTIYIDAGLFNDPKMTESMRAYVMLHEVIHSYFPMGMAERQLKLRSMVKAIVSIESGQIATREALGFQMRQNEVDFPTVTDQLDPYRAPIEYLVENPTQQQQDLLTLDSPGVNAIITLPQDTIAILAPWDNAYLTEYAPKQVLTTACMWRLHGDTTDDFSRVLADPALGAIQPALIAMSEAEALPPAKQAILFSGDVRQAVYDNVFGSIKNAKLALEADGRTTLDANASEALGVQTGAATPILDLPMPSELPPEFRSVANLIIMYAQKGQWDLVSAFAGPGSPFAAVVGLVPIHQAISAFKFTYTNEEEFSKRRITLLSQVLTQLLKQDFRNSLSSDDFNHVVQIVFGQQ